MKSRIFSLLAAIASFFVVGGLSAAMGTPAARLHAIPGGEKFTVQLQYQKAYNAVLAALKASGYEITESRQTSGVIATALQPTEKGSAKGRRLVVSFFPASESSTQVTALVTEQAIDGAANAQPEDLQPNLGLSKAAANSLKAAFGLK